MLKHNMQQFLKETNQAIEKELQKQQSTSKKIILEAYSMITIGSAVNTGLFRTSHIISYNSVDDTIPENADIGRLSYNASKVTGFKFNNGDRVYIQNNLKYAEKLEQGSSQQQPAGLYLRTEETIRRLLDQRL